MQRVSSRNSMFSSSPTQKKKKKVTFRDAVTDNKTTTNLENQAKRDEIPLFDIAALGEFKPNGLLWHMKNLYQKGAGIINTGKTQHAETPEMQLVMKKKLLGDYNKIYAYTAHNENQSANNPLHLVYILNVALDHTDPLEIVSLYFRLKYAYQVHDIPLMPFNFPNDSSILNMLFIVSMLRGYILNHLSRFTFLSMADIAAVADKDDHVIGKDYFHIIGIDDSSGKGRLMIEAIFGYQYDMPAVRDDAGMRIISLIQPK